MKNRDYNRYLLSFIDLTSLNSNDTPADIEALCQKALNPAGNVKAICIYPQFITLARSMLQGSTIKIATVCNFPEGNKSLSAALKEVEIALNFGADEIDLVMPYHEFLQGNHETTTNLVNQAKQLCRNKILKVILETGAYDHSQLIADASITAIYAGADFIKTSTGKITQGGTLPAANAMFFAIKETQKAGFNAGFKASGGVRTIDQAQSFITLAEGMLGLDWVTPEHFRIGASGLVDAILQNHQVGAVI